MRTSRPFSRRHETTACVFISPGETAVVNGKIDAAMTRVVGELEDVGPNDGGTIFLVGSHKSNFPLPASEKALVHVQAAFFEVAFLGWAEGGATRWG